MLRVSSCSGLFVLIRAVPCHRRHRVAGCGIRRADRRAEDGHRRRCAERESCESGCVRPGRTGFHEDRPGADHAGPTGVPQRSRRAAGHRHRPGRRVSHLVRPSVRRRRRLSGAVRILLHRAAGAAWRKGCGRYRIHRAPHPAAAAPGHGGGAGGRRRRDRLLPSLHTVGRCRRAGHGLAAVLPELATGDELVGLSGRRPLGEPTTASVVDGGPRPVLPAVSARRGGGRGDPAPHRPQRAIAPGAGCTCRAGRGGFTAVRDPRGGDPAGLELLRQRCAPVGAARRCRTGAGRPRPDAAPVAAWGDRTTRRGRRGGLWLVDRQRCERLSGTGGAAAGARRRRGDHLLQQRRRRRDALAQPAAGLADRAVAGQCRLSAVPVALAAAHLLPRRNRTAPCGIAGRRRRRGGLARARLGHPPPGGAAAAPRGTYRGGIRLVGGLSAHRRGGGRAGRGRSGRDHDDMAVRGGRTAARPRGTRTRPRALPGGGGAGRGRGDAGSTDAAHRITGARRATAPDPRRLYRGLEHSRRGHLHLR